MAANATETTVLLTTDQSTYDTRAEDHTNDSSAEVALLKQPDVSTTWQEETGTLFKYSAPLIVTYLLQYSFSLVVILVAGRIGTNELAAASLAFMTAGITGTFVYEGLATSLDTLAAQAYGAGKKHLVGLHVQRMLALMTVVTIPIAVAWFASPWILQLIIPEKELARLAGAFMRIYLLGALGYAYFEAGKRFVQAQGNFTAALVVLLICAPLNIFWQWLFVFKLQLGFEGAALAVAISNNSQPVLLVAYIYFFAPATLECWPGINWKAIFSNWGPMVRLSIAGLAMTFCEWLAFDMLTFSASYLSTEALAAQSVLNSIGVFIFHIPFPISIAASTRFGNLIGFGAFKSARKAFKLYYAIFAFIGVMDIILLTSLRNVIPQYFTDDPKVRKLIAQTMPVLAALQVFDATTALSNALLRGLGRQHVGGWVNLGAYYVFAIPLSLFLTFGPLKMGLSGLWYGPCAGLGLCTFALATYMATADWRKAVEEARMREE